MGFPVTLVYYDRIKKKETQRQVVLRELTPTIDLPIVEAYGQPLKRLTLKYSSTKRGDYYCADGYFFL